MEFQIMFRMKTRKRRFIFNSNPLIRDLFQTPLMKAPLKRMRHKSNISFLDVVLEIIGAAILHQLANKTTVPTVYNHMETNLNA